MSEQVAILEQGMMSAIEEAESSLVQGGIPIGAALADANGDLVGAGHNQRFSTQRSIALPRSDVGQPMPIQPSTRP
jgi:tRNA(Arg) A34 adenosine deaminase TadA